jgi:hypothetical protein
MSTEANAPQKTSRAPFYKLLAFIIVIMAAFVLVLMNPEDEEYSAAKLDTAVTNDFGAQMDSLRISSISSPHCFGYGPDDDAATRTEAVVSGEKLVFKPKTPMHGCVGFQARRSLDGEVRVTFQSDPDKVPYDDVRTAVYARLAFAVQSVAAMQRAQAAANAKAATAASTWN